MGAQLMSMTSASATFDRKPILSDHRLTCLVAEPLGSREHLVQRDELERNGQGSSRGRGWLDRVVAE